MTTILSSHDISPPTVDVVAEPGSDRLHVHVRGEIDIATHDDLSRLLEAVDLTPYDVVDVHLGELDFCDSHGVRQLVLFTDTARTHGCEVELHDASRQLARLLALVAPSAAA